MPVYSLGERRVEFRGRDWFVAPTASVIGSVVIENEAAAGNGSAELFETTS